MFSHHSDARNNVRKQLAVIGLLSTILSGEGAAQERGRNIVVGLRSGLISGSMGLSRLDPAFQDLSNDGPKGPHMSGFYLLVAVRTHLRVGVETLVSNSNQDAATTMNYQAAGPVAELTFGSTWFVSAGAQAGGVIVNAMSRTVSSATSGASNGTYFKSNGAFVAPYIDIGRRFRRTEVGVYAKRVATFGGEERGTLSPFSSTFVGLRLGIRM